MCVLSMNSKGLQLLIIGCLTLVAMQSPAEAQLFKRRSARQNQQQPAQAETNGQDQTARPNAAQANRNQARAAQDTNSAAPPANMANYQVPNTTNVDELVKYLSDLLKYTPQSKEDAEAYRQRAPQAMTLAAQKILVNEKNKTSDNYRFAEKYLLAVDVMSIDQASAEEKQNIMEIIIKNLKHAQMDADDLDIAVAFTEGLEGSGGSPDGFDGIHELRPDLPQPQRPDD